MATYQVYIHLRKQHQIQIREGGQQYPHNSTQANQVGTVGQEDQALPLGLVKVLPRMLSLVQAWVTHHTFLHPGLSKPCLATLPRRGDPPSQIYQQRLRMVLFLQRE